MLLNNNAVKQREKILTFYVSVSLGFFPIPQMFSLIYQIVTYFGVTVDVVVVSGFTLRMSCLLK